MLEPVYVNSLLYYTLENISQSFNLVYETVSVPGIQKKFIIKFTEGFTVGFPALEFILFQLQIAKVNIYIFAL